MKKVRKYRSHKFIYQADNGKSYIRMQREHLQYDSNEPIIPLTSVFQSAKLFDETDPLDSKYLKITKLREGETDRHCKVSLPNADNLSQYESLTYYCPYPDLVNIRHHIEELRDSASKIDQFSCVDYYGEIR